MAKRQQPRQFVGGVPCPDDAPGGYFGQLAFLEPGGSLSHFYITKVEEPGITDVGEGARTIDAFCGLFGIEAALWTPSVRKITVSTAIDEEYDAAFARRAEAAGETVGSFITRLAYDALPIEYGEEDGDAIVTLELFGTDRVVRLEGEGYFWPENSAGDVGWSVTFLGFVGVAGQSSV